jgi:hypothetical protein
VNSAFYIQLLVYTKAEMSLTTVIRPRHKAWSNLSIAALSSSVSESSNNAAINPYRSAKVILPEQLT